MKKYLLTLFAVFSLSLTSTFAQNMELGVSLGAANYMGDLVESDIFILEETNFLFGLNYRFVLAQNLHLRGDLTFSKLTGDDQNSDLLSTYHPNLKTEVSYVGGDFLVEYFFTDRFERADVVDPGTGKVENMITDTTNVRPYLLVGVGGLFTNPDITVTPIRGDEPTMIPEQSAGNPENHFMVTFGAGIRFELSSSLMLSVEGQMKYGFTDYLDGISETRNPDQDDWMATGGLNLSYRFSAGNERAKGKMKR